MVIIFTKFDAQIIQEYVKLDKTEGGSDEWDKARTHAENTYKEVYLSKILNTYFPPKAYVKLEGENNKFYILGL